MVILKPDLDQEDDSDASDEWKDDVPVSLMHLPRNDDEAISLIKNTWKFLGSKDIMDVKFKWFAGIYLSKNQQKLIVSKLDSIENTEEGLKVILDKLILYLGIGTDLHPFSESLGKSHGIYKPWDIIIIGPLPSQ